MEAFQSQQSKDGSSGKPSCADARLRGIELTHRADMPRHFYSRKNSFVMCVYSVTPEPIHGFARIGSQTAAPHEPIVQMLVAAACRELAARRKRRS